MLKMLSPAKRARKEAERLRFQTKQSKKKARSHARDIKFEERNIFHESPMRHRTKREVLASGSPIVCTLREVIDFDDCLDRVRTNRCTDDLLRLITKGVICDPNAVKVFSLSVPCKEMDYVIGNDERTTREMREAYTEVLTWIVRAGLQELDDAATLLAMVRASFTDSNNWIEMKESGFWGDIEVLVTHLTDDGKWAYFDNRIVLNDIRYTFEDDIFKMDLDLK